MSIRDQVECVVRSWDLYERERGAPPVIDFDCAPRTTEHKPPSSRLHVLRQLEEIRKDAANAGGDQDLVNRIDAHTAYLRALMGERMTLDSYVRSTQGCGTAGWPADYIHAIGAAARESIESIGITWGRSTPTELREVEGPIDAASAPEAIRQEAATLEHSVRDLVGADAPFALTIELVDLDVYWAYWLDGSGHEARLRINSRRASFTKVTARQFALHEVLGHGLQGASFAARCAVEDVPWIRLLSVHAPHQVLLEGLAQTLPLFVLPEDEALITRVKLEHFTYLVRAELHRAVNSGTPIEECARYAIERVPWWDETALSEFLTDRSADPLLRSYLWSYPAGHDWFTALAKADAKTRSEVLHAAYRDPLTPTGLKALWPGGPPIGGPGR